MFLYEKAKSTREIGLKAIKAIRIKKNPKEVKRFWLVLRICFTPLSANVAAKGSRIGAIGMRYLEVTKNKITDAA